ncbi:MAG: MFS transporter [Lentisphaerae bacterium]|nr:MFS transporter [Lentisphaerota bacterium]
MPVFTPDPRLEGAEFERAGERTRRLSVAEGAAWSAMYGFGDAYLAPFAVFLRAGNHAMAFLGTAPLVVGAIAQLAGASLTERIGRRKPLLVLTTATHAVCYLLLFALPFLARDRAVPVLLAVGAALAWLASFGTPAWTSWMGDLTAPAQRGRYFARRNSTLTLTMVASMLAAAALLSAFRARGWIWAGFAALFTVAALARATSSWLFTRHHEPPLTRSPESYFSFWDYLRRAPRSNFTKFSLAVAMMNGAVNTAGPFFSVYMLRDLHWTYFQFTSSTVVYLVAQSVVYRWWGAICDRHGARSVLKATSVILPVLPLLWASTTSYPALLGAQVLSGCTWAGFNLASTNFVYDAVTPQKRARVVGYHGLLNAFFTLAGGNLVGATIAEAVPAAFSIGPIHVTLLSSLPVVFVVSSLLRVLAATIMLPRFHEVREVEHVGTLQILRRLGTGEPVVTAGMELATRLPILGRFFPPRPGDPPAGKGGRPVG